MRWLSSVRASCGAGSSRPGAPDRRPCRWTRRSSRRPAGDRSIGEAIRPDRAERHAHRSCSSTRRYASNGVGQPIRGHVIEPVYAFDKLVIPTGTEVTGEISQIESVPNAGRALAALDADFTPARKIRIKFSGLALPDGKHSAPSRRA